MTERRFQQVLDRELSLLLPPSLEEYVSADNPVRAIDVWVRGLGLQQQGFKHTEANRGVGQPAYDPAVSLKLYLFGCQRGGRSSRKFEYQTHCNTEKALQVADFRVPSRWGCYHAPPLTDPSVRD